MKHLFFAVVLLVTLPLFAEDKPDQATSDANLVLPLAKEFWTDLNLGDLDKAAALGRPEDAAVVPKPKSEAAIGMMKMKDLPELAKLRKEIADAMTTVFAFSPPVFNADGSTAAVTITPIATKNRTFFELKAIYTVYLAEAYKAKQAGKDVPTPESVTKEVIDPNSPEEKQIDQKMADLLNATFPPLVFLKTAQGWKVNLQAFFGQKP